MIVERSAVACPLQRIPAPRIDEPLRISSARVNGRIYRCVLTGPGVAVCKDGNPSVTGSEVVNAFKARTATI